MYIDLALAGSQVALIVLKLTGHITPSWWRVLLPSILWLVLGIIARYADRDDDKTNGAERK